MRTVTGSPVEHDDFFDRPRALARLQRELADGANPLLTAPRRVGKTSLVLRLRELEHLNYGAELLAFLDNPSSRRTLQQDQSFWTIRLAGSVMASATEHTDDPATRPPWVSDALEFDSAQ